MATSTFLSVIHRPRSGRPTTTRGHQIINLGKIELRIYQGDITSAGVDVIAYSSNKECDLSRGLFKYLQL